MIDKQKIIIDNLKSLLKRALQKTLKDNSADDAKLFIVWSDDINGISLHMITTKNDVGEKTVLSKPIKNLSELISVLENMSYKAMGFNIDVKAPEYITSFYQKYCTNLNISKNDCNFYICLYKDDVVAVFNPKSNCNIPAKQIPVSEIINIK